MGKISLIRPTFRKIRKRTMRLYTLTHIYFIITNCFEPMFGNRRRKKRRCYVFFALRPRTFFCHGSALSFSPSFDSSKSSYNDFFRVFVAVRYICTLFFYIIARFRRWITERSAGPLSLVFQVQGFNCENRKMSL